MKRMLVLLLLLAGCTSPAVTKDSLPCSWNASTQAGFLSTFQCLDGSQPPQGLPAPAIVNVWGSWCDPCKEEIPFLITLKDKYPVTIIGIDVDEPKIETGQAFAEKSGMTWANLYDVKGESVSVFGPGVPVTWFIDANGEVVHKHVGVWKSYTQLETTARKYGFIQ